MTRRLILGAIAAVMLLVIVMFVRHARHEEPPEAQAKSGAGDMFRPTDAQWDGLKVVAASSLLFHEERMAEGKIVADGDRTTPVFSPYSGRVLGLIAKPGDHVKKGDPLMTMEATEFAQVQNDRVAARSTLATAESQYSLAAVKEHRQHALFDAKAAARQDWEQSRLDLESAKNAMASAKAGLTLVENRLRIFGRSGGEGGTAVVTAPIAGSVIDRQVAVGQYINSVTGGATAPVYTIGDLSSVWLTANVEEAGAPFVHVGNAVEARLNAFPDQVFHARLDYVASGIDPATHRLPVRAVVENPDGLLKPEMFAELTIITGAGREEAGVPESAVIYEGDAAHVWVAGDDHTLALRAIKTGPVQHDRVAVVSGLKPGEKVVTSGALFIDRAASGD